MENISVAIVIVNYNTWPDTIKCLKSIFRNSFLNYNIIVVDNGSTNNSFEKIADWLLLERTQFAPQGFSFSCIKENEVISDELELTNLILLKSIDNRGFAAGNNKGIIFLKKLKKFDYYWLLNNDTEIEHTALVELCDYAVKNHESGIIGNKIFDFFNRNEIQSIGGLYNKWIGTTSNIGAGIMDDGRFDNISSKSIDFIVGASMFVSSSFIEKIGMMSEDYFLYYEELDWILRGKRDGFKIGYCPQSKIYHKGGGSINNSESSFRSKLADYHGLRSKLIFTRKFYPYSLPIIWLSSMFIILNRVRKGKFDRVSMLFNLIKQSILRQI